MEKSGKKAFTLVELLVVIAIIGMLMGLLLPAVQNARESARVMQCTNNLKNIGMAAMNHEATTQKLPSGGWCWNFTGDPDRGLNKNQPGGWTYSILPFIEQQTLFDYPSNGQKDSPDKAKTTEILQIPVAIFNCPSRRRPKVYPGANDSLVNGTSANLKKSGTCMVAKTDYAANYGGSVSNPGSARYYPGSYATANTYSENNSWPKQTANGVIFSCSEIGTPDIWDGASNTYLIGEKYLQADKYETSTASSDDNGIWTGADCDNCRVTYQSSSTNPCQDRRGYDEYSMRFGGPHFGEFGMVMCDGSAHRVSYSIDAQTHYYLGIRNDEQAVQTKF